MRTRVKLCGIRSVEDALLAARAGADAIGVIQVPTARRFVPLAQAAEICHSLPAYVTPVLVFADAPIDDIILACNRTGCRTVQLHGHEPIATALTLHAVAGVSIVKRLEVGVTLRSELDHWSRIDPAALGGLLLEGPGRGGGGVESDWDAIHWALTGTDPTSLPPIVLAGGLSPDNVYSVIRRLKPHAVDTSSGVENPAEPTRKDPRRVEAFLDAVHAADFDEAERD